MPSVPNCPIPHRENPRMISWLTTYALFCVPALMIIAFIGARRLDRLTFRLADVTSYRLCKGETQAGKTADVVAAMLMRLTAAEQTLEHFSVRLRLNEARTDDRLDAHTDQLVDQGRQTAVRLEALGKRVANLAHVNSFKFDRDEAAIKAAANALLAVGHGMPVSVDRVDPDGVTRPGIILAGGTAGIANWREGFPGTVAADLPHRSPPSDVTSSIFTVKGPQGSP
jgi:hypothetical protein